jgi:sorbitol-specific phosphotransferase system component IIBC
MRVYDIAVFMFVLQTIGGAIIAGGFLQQMGFYPDVLTIHTDIDPLVQQARDEQNRIANNITQAVSQSSDPLATAFGMFYSWMMSSISSLISAVNPIIYYVAWIPLIMQQAGIPGIIAWPFFAVYTALETIGFLQLISGRSFKEFE